MTTSGALKIEKFFLDKCRNEGEFNKNILSMPCGTGKTFVSFLLSLEYNNIIILTPLISTTEQIHAHYKNYYSKYKNINFNLNLILGIIDICGAKGFVP